jgi:membrane protein involved in colicin uptake
MSSTPPNNHGLAAVVDAINAIGDAAVGNAARIVKSNLDLVASNEKVAASVKAAGISVTGGSGATGSSSTGSSNANTLNTGGMTPDQYAKQVAAELKRMGVTKP